MKGSVCGTRCAAAGLISWVISLIVSSQPYSGHRLDGVLTAGLQGCDGIQNIDADKRGMSQNVPSTARVAAGVFWIFDLDPSFRRTERYGAPIYLMTLPSLARVRVCSVGKRPFRFIN
jgi:hypothetical protein